MVAMVVFRLLLDCPQREGGPFCPASRDWEAKVGKGILGPIQQQEARAASDILWTFLKIEKNGRKQTDGASGVERMPFQGEIIRLSFKREKRIELSHP